MHSLKHLLTTTIAGGFSDKILFSLPVVGEFLGHQIIEMTKISYCFPFTVAIITSIASTALNHWIDNHYFFLPTEIDAKQQLSHFAVTVLTGAVTSIITTGIAAFIIGTTFSMVSTLGAGASTGAIVYVTIKIIRWLISMENRFFQDAIVTFINDCQETTKSSEKIKTVVKIKINESNNEFLEINYLSVMQSHGWANVPSKIHNNGRIIYANNHAGFIQSKSLVIKSINQEVARIKKVLEPQERLMDTCPKNKLKEAWNAINVLRYRLNDFENALRHWNDVGQKVQYGFSK